MLIFGGGASGKLRWPVGKWIRVGNWNGNGWATKPNPSNVPCSLIVVVRPTVRAVARDHYAPKPQSQIDTKMSTWRPR